MGDPPAVAEILQLIDDSTVVQATAAILAYAEHMAQDADQDEELAFNWSYIISHVLLRHRYAEYRECICTALHINPHPIVRAIVGCICHGMMLRGIPDISLDMNGTLLPILPDISEFLSPAQTDEIIYGALMNRHFAPIMSWMYRTCRTTEEEQYCARIACHLARRNYDEVGLAHWRHVLTDDQYVRIFDRAVSRDKVLDFDNEHMW